MEFLTLTVVAGDTAADSLISIKASASASGAEEYLMHVTGVAYTLLSPLGVDYISVTDLAVTAIALKNNVKGAGIYNTSAFFVFKLTALLRPFFLTLTNFRNIDPV